MKKTLYKILANIIANSNPKTRSQIIISNLLTHVAKYLTIKQLGVSLNEATYSDKTKVLNISILNTSRYNMDRLIIAIYYTLTKVKNFMRLGKVKIVIMIGFKDSEEFTISNSFIFTEKTTLEMFYNHFSRDVDSLRAREYPVDELDFVLVTARDVSHMINKVVNLDNLK